MAENGSSPGVIDDLPVIAPGQDALGSTARISATPLSRRTPRWWLPIFGLAFLATMMLLYAIGYLFAAGIGIWGVNIPVAWGFAIVNFVWWIGIGHAGTLISAILLLFRQQWRTSINRFAEAMTLFAVACAGLFPLLHLGRPGLFYYLLPYPNTMGMWPQFRSPLVWDAFAVGTYFTVSLIFWYVGIVPDMATMRDRAQRRGAKRLYNFFALGWRYSARHWHRYQLAYLLFAGLATPLVVSVHSIVSLDFSVSQLPGWHSTVFPPYFVAGAIFSGFAMVLTLVIPLRAAFGWHDFITARHLDNMAKITLVTGLVVAYGYVMEFFIAWYSGNIYEQFMAWNRALGPYGPAFWAMVLCNVAAPQTLWFTFVRRSPVILFFISIIINVGMWLERFVIVIVSLHRDFMPSAWEMYAPTGWDWATFIGTIGLFVALFFLFVRLLPAISMFEVRELIHHQAHEAGGH